MRPALSLMPALVCLLAAHAAAAEPATTTSATPVEAGGPAPFAPPEPPSLPPSPSNVALPDTGDPAELPPRAPARPGNVVAVDTGSDQVKVARGAYVHDGVFARLAVGPGWFQASSGSSHDKRSFSGGTVSFHGQVGGAPIRGFVFGAEFETDRVFDLSSTDAVTNGNEPDLGGTRFSLNSLGVFGDFYPDPSDGLHFMAAVGVGWLSVSHSRVGSTPNPSGAVLSAGGGYEWFVGPNVSLGVLVRANVGLFGVDETGTSTDVTTFVPALLAEATYN